MGESKKNGSEYTKIIIMIKMESLINVKHIILLVPTGYGPHFSSGTKVVLKTKYNVHNKPNYKFLNFANLNLDINWTLQYTTSALIILLSNLPPVVFFISFISVIF